MVLSLRSVAALAAAALLPACGGEHRELRLQLAKPPYMGVRCPGPNSLACDRVGLAVWLRRPASHLEATIADKPLRMGIPRGVRFGRGTYFGPRGAYYEGFLRPAGLTRPGPLRVTPDGGDYYWVGRHPLDARVRLVARFRDGSSASTTVRVPLRPGWG